MGIYSEYLDRSFTFEQLSTERKKQLARIAALRGRPVLVYAADFTKGNAGAPISIDYSDLLPFNDQLANLSGKAIDVLLETPGGDGTVAEDIVRLLRGKFSEVGFIIPGHAKSAGTIIAMSGDEILMGPTSALGPIDAQMFWQGKVFSAEALLEGMEKIKREVSETGALNKAFIPILQGISPGELQSAQNALDFAKVLVTDWLARFKFKNWVTHSSTGLPVREEERKQRAKEIADQLCSHGAWLTHGRSIRMDDLKGMRLLITDFEQTGDLGDAIRRYHTLLQMTFATNIYKVIETPTSQIYRFASPTAQPIPTPGQGKPNAAILQVKCNKCGNNMVVQANIGSTHPLQPGKIPYPADNRLKCTVCGTETDLTQARQQIEAQSGLPLVP
jgi:ribosomal protein S27E